MTGFHLDEYVGIPATHKASFRGYMRERFVAKTPQPLKVFNEVNGEAADPDAEIARLEKLLRVAPIDVATWCSVCETSERSVRNGSLPEKLPDFTRGAWERLAPKPIRDIPFAC